MLTMSGFTPAMFEKKLSEMNSSQQSIQALSLLLIHHRRHYKLIVEQWLKELKKVKPSKQLTFMYLANDVIQNSRKKTPEYSKEFSSVLEPAIEHITKNADENTKKSIARILTIWEERGIYDKKRIQTLQQALNGKLKTKINKRKHDEISSSTLPDTDKLAELLPKINNLVQEFAIDLEKREQVEPEKLMKALKELETSNTTKEKQNMLKKIATMPPEVFDAQLLESRLEREGKEHWKRIIEEAQELLNCYSTNLAQEMKERKQLAEMLVSFTESQRSSLKVAEENLAEYRKQLHKVTSVREAINSHLSNLPDLTQTVTPLPSASDLFKK